MSNWYVEEMEILLKLRTTGTVHSVHTQVRNNFKRGFCDHSKLLLILSKYAKVSQMHGVYWKNSELSKPITSQSPCKNDYWKVSEI